jgi:hypothetical protein
MKLTQEQVNAAVESLWQEYNAKNPARLLTPNQAPEQILEMGFRVGVRLALDYAQKAEEETK